jgi:potassium efflux system protein
MPKTLISSSQTDLTLLNHSLRDFNPDMRPLIYHYRSSIILPLVSLFVLGPALAQMPPVEKQTDNLVSSRQKFIAEEKIAIATEESDLESWKARLAISPDELLSRSIEQTELDQAGLAVETRKVVLESIDLDISAAEQVTKELTAATQDLRNRLQSLAATPDKATIEQTKAILKEEQALLELEQQHIKQLNRKKQLAKERLSLAEKWLARLQETFQRQQESARQQTLEELGQRLAEEHKTWQAKATELRTQLIKAKGDPSSLLADNELLEARFLEAEESIFLIDNRLKTAQIRAVYERVKTDTAELTPDPRSQKATLDELQRLSSQLKSITALMRSKAVLLQQRLEVIDKRRGLDAATQPQHQQMHAIFTRLVKQTNKQLDEIATLQKAVQEHASSVDAAYLEHKKRGLKERHRLPDNMEEWRDLLNEMTALPVTTLLTVRHIALSLRSATQQSDASNWLLLALLALLWISACLALGLLKRFTQPTPEQDFTHKALFVVAALLISNRFSLLFGGLLITAAWMLEIIPPGLALLSSLVAIWLGAKLTIGLSRWVLKSPVGLSQQQPGLHRLMVGFTVTVSLFSLGLALGHLGFLSDPLHDLFGRTFMLLLLPLAYLALRIRNLLMEVVREHHGEGYWARLLGFTGYAIPLAIFAAALLGIYGYINLAWSIAGNLAIFIIVVAGWLVARGLLIDLAHSIEKQISHRSDQSIFWIKSVVEPLHFLLRIILFLVVASILYRIFGGDPATGIDLKAWIKSPLFSIGDTSINSLNLFSSLLLLVLVFYLGRWARQITYGWLYSNIQDLGIRNSLSVFTQYAVVVLGLLIALNILGINLTSLTVFAGALGVGIGFGLQNIANNFISGLILLAERPVRTSDWVTIGDKEGEVSEIGMRSVTVTTWDNQDVIIPNSDLISNAFINWTRTNSIVRTVLYIGIRYQDDPHKAQKVIEEAVAMQPEVVLDPSPKVWLMEFGASSVDFRVHYHVDVKQFNRLETKSKVMFAIWDALKEAGIGIPFPQQDIYIKELPTAHGYNPSADKVDTE